MILVNFDHFASSDFNVWQQSWYGKENGDAKSTHTVLKSCDVLVDLQCIWEIDNKLDRRF